MLGRLYPPLSPAMRNRVITLWLVLFLGSLIVGGIGLYMGTFIRSNVRDQLTAQQIQFTPADQLTDVERNRNQCLTENGGKLLENGDQARCYSDHYILLHMEESAQRAGFPGGTYATLGAEQTKLRAEIAAAQQAGNQDAQRQANERLTAVTNLRNTMQTGSTLRGQLLNAWGWDTFGIGVQAGSIVVLLLAAVFLAALIYELTLGAATATGRQ